MKIAGYMPGSRLIHSPCGFGAVMLHYFAIVLTAHLCSFRLILLYRCLSISCWPTFHDTLYKSFINLNWDINKYCWQYCSNFCNLKSKYVKVSLIISEGTWTYCNKWNEIFWDYCYIFTQQNVLIAQSHLMFFCIKETKVIQT